jgi:hypothetical protein
MKAVSRIRTEDILISIPITDANFLNSLSNATIEEINNTITLLQRKRRTKTRIAVCKRELQKRVKSRNDVI